MVDATNLASIATVTYFCLYVVLLIVVGLMTCGSSKSLGDCVVTSWKRRSIYSPTIVHFYDTATDIGVMILWGDLAFKQQRGEIEIPHVNMMVFFILGIVFIALYRIGGVVASQCYEKQATPKERLTGFLALFDLAIFWGVFEAHNEDETEIESGSPLWIMQIGETIAESVPEAMLQSVYLIRTWNSNIHTDSNQDTFLVILSIIGSYLSILNKIIKIDEDWSYGYATRYSNKKNVCNFKKNKCINFSIDMHMDDVGHGVDTDNGTEEEKAKSDHDDGNRQNRKKQTDEEKKTEKEMLFMFL